MNTRKLHLAAALLAVGAWSLSPCGWAEDAAPVVTSAPAPAVPATPVTVPEVVVLDDEAPAGATTTGAWLWESSAASGTKSHGHAAADGVQQHAVTFETPLAVPKNGEIVTSAWLDPANPPKGMMIKFTLASGDEAGVYWEGEEEVFNPGEDEEIWYYGLLPEFGVWTPLAVAAEDLGIEDASIKTITFVTHGGRALWDRTVMREITETPLPAGLGAPSTEGSAS